MTILTTPASCTSCHFTTADTDLLARHSCDIQEQGGTCEDFPACGHERGDCNGLLYGSDEYIKEQVYEQIRSGHGDCNHAEGQFFCEDWDDDEYDEEECGGCEDEENAPHTCGL
jgi:hypothetical protein